MLAQLNSKQKSLFFNIKPTVIDRLISKNKSSIQNSLLCTNEESDGSVSEESEDSSSSSQESSVTITERPSTMAPIRRNDKVLGSKLSARSNIALKRGRNKASVGQPGRSANNLKVMAAMKVLENRKRGRPRKIVEEVKTPNHRKIPEETPSTSTKRSRASVKKDDIPLTPRSKTNNTNKAESSTVKRKTKEEKGRVATSGNETESPSIPGSSLMPSVNTKTSLKKFPSNVVDRWKSTGMVIRGRGRPRGSLNKVPGAFTSLRGRGTFRGRGITLRGRGGRRVGALRSDRYITRDSQIGVMRSGKLRKYSNSDLVEGLEHVRKRRRDFNRVKVEKCDYPSDEHSSFVTTSELSFCENDNSCKQSDDEINYSRVKIKEEVLETDDEAVDSRDTNSNLFKGDKIKQEKKSSVSGSDTNDQSSDSKVIRKKMLTGPKVGGRGRKRLISLGKRLGLLSQSDSSVRDSDCSLDSDAMDDSVSPPNSGSKLHKRRRIDGVWVRRSTRSIGKGSIKAEPDAVVIEELLKEKDCPVDVECNSKSSLSVDVKHSESQLVNSFDKDKSLDSSTEAATETLVRKVDICNIDPIDSTEECPSIDDLVKKDSEVEVDVDEMITNKDDSVEDINLTLEESPSKMTVLTSKQETISDELLLESPDKMDYPDTEEKLKTPSSINDEQIKSEILPEPLLSINQSSIIQTTASERDDQNVPANNSSEENQINVKPMCTDGLNDLNSEASEHSISSSHEVMTDDKIITMIDSFCSQSDVPDLSNDDITQESTTVENDEDVIVEFVNKITTEVEQNVSQDNLQKLTTSINQLSGSIVRSCSETNKSFSSETSEVKHTDCDRQYLPLLSKDLTDICKETKNDETEFVKDEIKSDLKSLEVCKQEIGTEAIHFFKEEVSSSCETVEMESRLEKAPEITEESSSSDSNSNLSEITSISLEKDVAEAIPMGDLQLQGDLDESSLLANREAQSKIVTTETDARFSSVASSTVTSDIEHSNKDVSHALLSRKSSTEDNLEERPSKELLSALGLQSLLGGQEEKPKRPTDNYTGTLKAVIKLNRSSDKKSGGRKMIFKQGDSLAQDIGGEGDRLEYRICSAEQLPVESVPFTHQAELPARKAQIKVKSQFDLSSSLVVPSTETSSDSTKEPGGKVDLIIPEKSSSFSIHPERLCTDVCSYCFGKFGSLDTPCHLAQLKNAERQAKILAIEVHLSADSCLCDGCFRYVDRKANCPASQRSRKPAARRGPLAGTVCAVQECSQPARHSVRRKWLIKLKKSIGKKLVLDMDKNPHLPFPLCSQHYYWVDYFTVCGICKKRLTRNHMYALGPEAEELNQALSDDGIPVRLSDKLFLCKLCRYYSSLRLKYRDPQAMSSTHRLFLNSYRKKILQYHDIPVSESEEDGKPAEEDRVASEPPKPKKKKSKSKSIDSNESKKRTLGKEAMPDHGAEDQSNDSQMIDYSYLETLNIHREEPPASTVDYNSLGDLEGGLTNIASLLNPLESGQGTVYPSDSQNRGRVEKPTRIQVKFGNLNIGKLSNLNIGQDTRPASNATPAAERPPYLPGERELKLTSEFEFHGTLNPSSGWERYTSTIQFDKETKRLWQELQRPYGNQSSFLRHLVILEKHWRNGSLVLAENANPRAVKYLGSVKNRVQAYDGAKSSDMEKPKQPELTIISPPPRPVSTPVKSAPPPLMKIAPGTTPWLHEQLKKPPPYTSTPATSTSSKSLQSPAPAPPPYRLPVQSQTTNQTARPARVPTPMPGLLRSPQPPNMIRPISLSFQQFKRIRLEQPPASASSAQVTVIPKVELPPEVQALTSNASTSTDFCPRICEVRSLASPTSDWNESFRKQQQKMLKQNIAKYYTPILPKMPNTLSVTSFPQTTALVMKTSSLTIEKAPSINTKPALAPPEKPSISVFRETTPSDNG
ncbi:uncharacterized protein LOC128985862 [Macrosteles quadrilineatus]|uniref:uncharacterized protein LOC128985862 n=1 Tax=Macrosteles quadrilineatus TaxID=74068 RepID=UPI0023E15998|nr:uncharacterized protein LOC128985862 [Macrosteles quadrilineatus]